MGQPKVFEPEKLVFAVLASAGGARAEVLAALQERFGPADLVSDELPFDYTDYYAAEMGHSLRRYFYSARALVAPERLADIKRATNALESRFRHSGQRRANIDPGLLCLNRFVLASTKGGPHRIPLAHGIYGELTLLYESGRFRPLPWTYPDYRSPAYLSVLAEIRQLYRRQRRSG